MLVIVGGGPIGLEMAVLAVKEGMEVLPGIYVYPLSLLQLHLHHQARWPTSINAKTCEPACIQSYGEAHTAFPLHV